jgi:DNA repair protein RecO (recombination protein O)
MPQLKSEGIVLKTVNWKENSRIATIFTRDSGRQSIVDRGGRSLKAKRGRLMNFCRLEIDYFKSDKSGIGYISEVNPLEAFTLERDKTLGRLVFASAALELLYGLLPDEEPHEALYSLTIQFLRLTDNNPKQCLFPVYLGFFIRMLSYLGYRPNFSGCVICGKEIRTNSENSKESTSNGGFLFSPDRGGLVCSTCQIIGEYYIRLRPERLKQIRDLQTASLGEAGGINIKFREGEEILELLVSFLKYQADTRDLNSLKFLQKLKRTAE